MADMQLELSVHSVVTCKSAWVPADYKYVNNSHLSQAWSQEQPSARQYYKYKKKKSDYIIVPRGLSSFR